ncbi:MAG: serine/threonine protein kinase [Archangiaceae bacterium]|nr:serine/threonine protein kinase [Archangiaceae bacterium]
MRRDPLWTLPVPSESGPEISIDDVSPENQIPWSSGDVVGRYTLLAKIATGGMAEIWLAKQAGPRGFEKVIVIKRIVDSLSADPEFVEMFLDEARIAAQLNHPNIVQIYDLGEHAGAYYIAMEYLPGENLSAIARAAMKAGMSLPISHAVKIISGAAEGLGHAHSRHGVKGEHLNVVHRDVSPQNIIITYDGLVKLVDFGIAKAANRGSQTMGGQIKGKVAYMAPEQATGQGIDHRADLFSLAIVLYELVTKSRLFHREDQFQALSAVTSDEPVQPADVRNPDVPRELSEILSIALQKNPDDRYQDAAAFHHALENWLKTQPNSPSSSDIGQFMHRLFEARINARAKLIESASTGELTPSSGDVLKNDTDHSMPGRTGNRTAMRASAQRSRAALVLIPSALALVLSGVLLARMLIRRDDTLPPQPLAVAQPPAPVANVGTLVIDTEPPGADVTVDGNPVGKSPVVLPDQKLGKHEISAALEGRRTMSTALTLAEPGAKAKVLLPLPAELSDRAPPPQQQQAQQVKRPPPPPPVQLGKLSLQTQPWTTVTCNGKVLGDTPLIDVQLPAGKQLLKLVNEEKNISTSIEVEIKAGQTTKKQLKL